MGANRKKTGSAPAARLARVSRKTKETQIEIVLNIDGTGHSKINSGIPFMDHMLELFARHGFFDLELTATGDIEVDCHHTMEDLGLTLGAAIAAALADKKGVRRYGWCVLPMDEALVLASLDLSGRPYLVYDLVPPAKRIKDLDTALFHEFFYALASKAFMTLHLQLLKGEECHHVFEAVFKAFAKALDQATTPDPRLDGILSTKGTW